VFPSATVKKVESEKKGRSISSLEPSTLVAGISKEKANYPNGELKKKFRGGELLGRVKKN